MQLHDNSISHIAKIVQLAILTGTDIVDNLRAMQFVLTDDQKLDVNAEYVSAFEDNLNKLVEQTLSQDLTLTSDTAES